MRKLFLLATVAAVLFLGFLFLQHAMESTESEFIDYPELSESGHFEAGWVPRWIPEDSKDIRILIDHDTNRREVRFKSDKGLDETERCISGFEPVNESSPTYEGSVDSNIVNIVVSPDCADQNRYTLTIPSQGSRWVLVIKS